MVALKQKIGSLLQKDYFRAVVLWPTLFFLFLVLANAKIFRMEYLEYGDIALTALQIERASEFRELVGIYSRGPFNHFGPISFYYFAAMELPLAFVKSPHGRHMLAQALANLLVVFGIAHILFRSLGSVRRVQFFLLILLFGLAPLGSGFFFDIWGPAIIVLPLLWYYLACMRVGLGESEYIVPATGAAVLVLHNNISGTPVLVPLMFVSLVLFVRCRRRSGAAVFSGRDARYATLALLIALFTSIPPLIDQFAGQHNISRIVSYSLGNTSVRKFDTTAAYVFDFFARPFQPFFDVPGLFVMLALFAMLLFHLRSENAFLRLLVPYSILIVFLNLAAALKVPGDMVPHIFWHSFGLIALIIFGAALVLVDAFGQAVGKTEIAFRRAHFHLSWVGLALVCLLYYRPSLDYDDSAAVFFDQFQPVRSETYQIYFTPENLEQGAFAAGLALKFYREGYRVCFPSEWLFVYSGHMACPTNERLIRLTLQRSDSSLTEPPAQNLFRLGEREILVSRDTP